MNQDKTNEDPNFSLFWLNPYIDSNYIFCLWAEAEHIISPLLYKMTVVPVHLSAGRSALIVI